jgi:probable addiction module antidote protein
MEKLKTSKFDVAEHLRTPEEMAAYLEACIEEAPQDAAFIAKAVGDIARAKGMSQVAHESGLSRESLYKALSGERNPDFDTILRVMSALGLRLHATVESLTLMPDKHVQPTRKKHRAKSETRTALGSRAGR